MISSSVSRFLPACRTARPHRSSRLRGGRSPSISKLARLSASSMKLAARATRWAPVRPTVSRALAARSSSRNSVSALVRRMTGQNRPLPSRLSRTRWRLERRGLPVKYAFGSSRSIAAARGRVVHGEGAAGQDFVEIPGAPRRNAGRGGPDQSLDLGLGHRLEDPLQDQEIDVFVAKGEGQMIGESVAGPVSLVEDGPGPLLPVAPADMLFGDAARPPHRRRDGEGVHERRPAGQPACRLGTVFSWKIAMGGGSRRIRRKSVTLVENHLFLMRYVEIRYKGIAVEIHCLSAYPHPKVHQ